MSSDLQIILVDDAIEDAELVRRNITKGGFQGQVLHFSNGDDVLQFFDSTEKKASEIKLLILDINMPGLSGIDVLKELRVNRKIIDLPIIMMSSSMEERDINDCYSYGVNSYVVKPNNFIKFNQVVSAVTDYWIRLNIIPHAL